MIEFDLPGGVRVRVDASVYEKALRRMLEAVTAKAQRDNCRAGNARQSG